MSDNMNVSPGLTIKIAVTTNTDGLVAKEYVDEQIAALVGSVEDAQAAASAAGTSAAGAAEAAGTAAEKAEEALNNAASARTAAETAVSSAQTAQEAAETATSAAAEAKKTLESIPEDYKELAQEVGKLSEEMDAVYVSRTVTPTVGIYCKPDGTIGTNSAWMTAKLRVSEAFANGHLTGTGSITYYGSGYPSMVFTDADGVVTGTIFENYAIFSTATVDIVPAGSEFIHLNSTNGFRLTATSLRDDLVDRINAVSANTVSENNPALDIEVSDYIGEMARNLYVYKSPVNILHGEFTTGYIISSTGEVVANANYGYYDYIEVKGGTKICLSVMKTATDRHIIDYQSVAFYDADKQFISRVDGLIKAVPANARYARQNLMTAYATYKPMVEYTDADGTIADEYTEWIPPAFTVKGLGLSDYKDKRLCVFGDSLAANGSGGTDTWVQRVGDALGFAAVYNRGVGGSRVTDGATMYAYVDGDGDAYNRLAYTSQQSPAGYTEIDACCSGAARANTIPTDTDVLLILCGANDVGNTTMDAFKTAYKAMLDNIYARVPGAKVALCTMPFHYAFDTGAGAEIYEAYREAIREIGHEYGFPVIDFRRMMMVNKNNYASYMDSDKVHYNNANGRKRFAETALACVQDMRFLHR